MTKRNPYRVAEKVGLTIANALLCGVVGTAFGLVLFALFRDLGWWLLALIPAAALGLLLLMVIASGVFAATDWIKYKWRDAKYEWEYRAIKEEASK